MSTEKRAFADCPKCGEKPAEFQSAADKRMRWKCNGCGAEGHIIQESQPAPVREVKPHWSGR